MSANDGPSTEVAPAVDQGRLLVLFEHITALISPDDWARHLPACGYTNESPDCRCAQFGADLIALLRGHDAAARAAERGRWDSAIDAVRFYRHQRAEARSVLDHVADRLDEHTYDEFSAVLDDDWSDDGPVDDAVAALAQPTPTYAGGRDE